MRRAPDGLQARVPALRDTPAKADSPLEGLSSPKSAASDPCFRGALRTAAQKKSFNHCKGHHHARPYVLALQWGSCLGASYMGLEASRRVSTRGQPARASSEAKPVTTESGKSNPGLTATKPANTADAASCERAAAVSKPEFVASSVYDFARLERAVEHLADQHAALLKENNELRARLDERQGQMDALDAELRESKARRDVASQRLDILVAELDRLDAALECDPDSTAVALEGLVLESPPSQPSHPSQAQQEGS